MELQQISPASGSIISAFAESRIGGRPENQDSYKWKQTELGYLVTVCDGMGGGPGGKTASTIATEEIVAAISEAKPEEEEITNVIIKAIRRANMAIIEAGSQNPALQGMGSTATLLLLSEKSAFVAHVGDSRVYQIRGRKKIFRTFDHSMVFEMVKQGVISEEQARLSSQSNIITKALGIKPDVEVDVTELSYEKGDRFILCSDGIHGAMPEIQLIKLASRHKMSLGALTDDIATYVDNIGHNSGGGHDNLTLAIVETKIKSKLKSPMTKLAKFILLTLASMLLVSLFFNIKQCYSNSETTTSEKDTLVSKDTLAKYQRYKETINSISGITQQVESDDSKKLVEIREEISKLNKPEQK